MKKNEEKHLDSSTENKSEELSSQVSRALFDRTVRSVIKTHFKPHFSSPTKWEDLEKTLITDYFQDFFGDKYFSTLKILPENQHNPKFNDDQYLILIETRMIFREKLKHSNNTYHSRLFLKNFVNERLKPALKKIADIPNSKLSSIARDALKAMTIPDYKEKQEELRERKEKPSPPIWLIVSLITVLIFFKIVLDGLKFPNTLYFIFFVFLVMLGIVKIADTLSEKKSDKLIRESDVLIHKGLASERRFRSANLIEYCPPPILEKFLVLKSGEDDSDAKHTTESEESKQRMEKIKYWAPEIAERLLNEKEEMAEQVPDIVKIAKIKDVIYEPPGIPQSEDAKLIMEFYTDQTVAGEETGEIADEHPSQESYLDSPKNELTIEENQRESEVVSQLESGKDLLLPPPEKPDIVTDKRRKALKETLHAPEKRKAEAQREFEVDSRLAKKEKETPLPIPEEKNEYKIYSHKHPHGKPIGKMEYLKEIEQIEKKIGEHFLVIVEQKDIFYIEGREFPVPLAPFMALKLLIKDIDSIVKYGVLIKEVSDKEVDLKKAGKLLHLYTNTAHAYIRDLHIATKNKLKPFIKNKRKKGFILSLKEKKYFVILEIND